MMSSRLSLGLDAAGFFAFAAVGFVAVSVATGALAAVGFVAVAAGSLAAVGFIAVTAGAFSLGVAIVVVGLSRAALSLTSGAAAGGVGRGTAAGGETAEGRGEAEAVEVAFVVAVSFVLRFLAPTSRYLNADSGVACGEGVALALALMGLVLGAEEGDAAKETMSLAGAWLSSAVAASGGDPMAPTTTAFLLRDNDEGVAEAAGVTGVEGAAREGVVAVAVVVVAEGVAGARVASMKVPAACFMTCASATDCTVSLFRDITRGA
jgi:hypothetical protein